MFCVCVCVVGRGLQDYIFEAYSCISAHSGIPTFFLNVLAPAFCPQCLFVQGFSGSSSLMTASQGEATIRSTQCRAAQGEERSQLTVPGYTLGSGVLGAP